jgi:hypothetical protein
MKLKSNMVYGAAIGAGIGALGGYFLATSNKCADTCSGKTAAECIAPCSWVNNQCHPPPCVIGPTEYIVYPAIFGVAGAIVGGLIGRYMKKG